MKVREGEMNYRNPVLCEYNEFAVSRFKDVLNCISSFSYFKDKLPVKGSPQKEQSTPTKILVDSLSRHLQKMNDLYFFETEKRVDRDFRDSIDIFGGCQYGNIVIELDSNRADQVAKKFVSRSVLCGDANFLYVSYCYGGTKVMEKSENEVMKYFRYCSALATRMGFGYAAFVGS